MIRPFKCDDGKWGYKDNENNFIIPPTYNCAMPYDDGICWVKYLNWGCINLKEEILVPFIYQTVERLDPNVYKVRGLNGKYGIIDQHGNFILDTLFDNIIKECDDVLEIKSGDKKFYTDYKGVKLFENIDIEYICKLGHYTVAVTESSCIFLSKENIIEIPTQDGYMLLFNLRLNNKYIVSNRYDEQKVVVYNNKGEKIFSHNDDEGYHFCNEPLCEDILILKTKQGICLHNLITQEEKTFVSIKDFIKLNDQYIVTISSDEEKRWGIITSEGETVIPNIYAGIGTNFGNNNISGSYFDGKYIAASKDGETCGIIDMNQNIVVPFVYTRIENCADDLNGLLIARKDGNYGVINLKNEVVVDFVYSNIGHFYYGVAIAKKEGKYGAIDIKGNVVIPFEYEKINDFRECKYTIAKKHNSHISYDIYGNITINNSNNTLCSFNGLLKIDNKSTNWYYNSRGTMSNNLSGYCDWYGNEVISCNRIIEQEKSYILLSDNFKIPILNAWDESKVDIESVISQTNYYQLEKIETETLEQIQEGHNYYDLIIEFKGFYIFKSTRENISYIVNQKREIIFTSLDHTISLMYEDEDFIYLRYDNESDSYSYYDELRIILDKKTHDIKETIISTENAKLFIVEKNHKYGVFHKDLGYLLQNKYNWAQIIGNLVYVENDEIGYLLYNGQKLIKEIDKTKDLYNTRYELVSISPYYIGITKGYDPFMIIDIEGNIVLDNIHYYKSYDNIVIIDVNDKLESTKCYWDREDCLAIYSKDFQPLYPDEYMTNIIHCDCGIFIGKNANIHVIYDEYGKKLFSTDEYSIVNKFNDGLSIVCKKGHYGAIDVKGNEIVPCCHSEITDFKDGIATTIKYDEKIEIYSDGTMQSILYGKVIGNVTFHKNIFCQIIDGHLYFTDDQNIHIADYLNNNVHEVIAFIYKDGTYFLLNDLTYSHLTGKVFLVNKTGLIIHWGYSDALFRISSECVLCGIDKLIEQPMSINTIDRIVNGGLKRNCVLITSTGIVSDYISSVNECIHFILQDTMYRVINNTGCTLWENYEMMNISLKPDGSFKLYCFNCYLENDNHDKSQVYIKVWDNSTLESKNIICSSGLIDVSDIIFSLDKNYMVIPIERNRGYYNDRKELHLIVLGEDDEVIIDQNFGDSTFESIYNNNILLKNYDTEITRSWNEYCEEYDYNRVRNGVGYTLVSLSMGLMGESHNRRYFTIDNMVTHDDLKMGVYDLEKDKVLVPVQYKECYIKTVNEDLYTIVVGENDKLGLYYNDKKCLDCCCDKIESLSIHAEKKQDYYSPPLTMQTDYILFQKDNVWGVIYNGKILCFSDEYKIEGVNVIDSESLDYVTDFLVISNIETKEIFYKGISLGIFEPSEIKFLRCCGDISFLKLFNGDDEGLLGSNGCYIPIDNRKIRFDSLSSDCHICVWGDKVYELDGSTIYLGNENEVFVSFGFIYFSCIYVFWNSDKNEFVFYDSNKTILDYKKENNSSLGMVALIEDISEFVFSFVEKKFVKFPHSQEPQRNDEENNEEHYGYEDDEHSIYDNPYYDENLDMDQQSIEFWNNL